MLFIACKIASCEKISVRALDGNLIELSVLRKALVAIILSLLVLKTEVYPHQYSMGSFVDSSVGEPALVKS